MSAHYPDGAAGARDVGGAGLPPARPALVTEVTGEITPGSETVWRPASYAEWEARTRLTTVLAAWQAQMADERQMRRTFARWIFRLITLQIIAAFGLVIATGLGWLQIDVALLKIIIPAVLAEVFGLGLLVTKYLFSLPARQSLDGLAQGPTPSMPSATSVSTAEPTPVRGTIAAPDAPGTPRLGSASPSS